MLLIIFYGEFCSFHRLVMPVLESQFNYGECKLKSELQIKIGIREEEKQCREEIMQLWQFHEGCKISQPLRIQLLLLTILCTLSDFFQNCPYLIVIIF